MKQIVHVIAHTHWDRSWYWPFERFRLSLVDCVKAVVRELRAHPDYVFTFDGQTLMLEDYLEVCPEDREFLQKCAREERIRLGPMYVLSDLYCTGGEALVRNLLIGAQWCRTFGAAPAQVLHMPDTFGITPSIPMIASGFGMRAFSFMRGMPGEVPGLTDMVRVEGGAAEEDLRFFVWRSADGSEIPVIRLRDGYGSAAARIGRAPGERNPSEEGYAHALVEVAKKWDAPPGKPILAMAGVDHQPPWQGQKPAMERASALGDYQFIFSTLDMLASDAFAAGTAGLPCCEGGEFHGDGAASVLGGTISSRIYLKMENAAIEQLLVSQVEPAAALLRLLGIEDSSFPLIAHAWKILLRTHPHDDICGCSVDAVHRKNESDMQQARESADALRRRFFGLLMRHFGANLPDDPRPSFALMNFQPEIRTGPACIPFDFEGRIVWNDIRIPDTYRIVNEAGEVVPFREIRREASVEHPNPVVHLELYAPLPPFSLQRFYFQEMPPETNPLCPEGATSLSPGQASAPPCPEWAASQNLLNFVAPPSETVLEEAGQMNAENDFFQVCLRPNGSFDLTDKASGITRAGIGLFSCQGDIGDTYDFSDIPGEVETVFDHVPCALSRHDWPGGVVALTAAGELPIPADTDAATRSRCSRISPVPFTLTLVIAPAHRRLEVRLDFVNTASNHRLRWNLPTPGNPKSSTAGLKFEVLERAAGSRPSGNVPPRIFPEHPADAFVAADGLACFSRFPFNYELVQQETPRLAITVLRSISYLCHPIQGATRPGTGAGPVTPTPEAACLGRRFSMTFALRLHEAEGGGLLREALAWRAQPLYGQCDPTMEYPYRTADLPVASGPAIACLAAHQATLVLSALKPAEDGRGVIARFHNASDRTQEVRFPSAISLVRLDESPDQRADAQSLEGEVRASIPPFGLLSFRLQ